MNCFIVTVKLLRSHELLLAESLYRIGTATPVESYTAGELLHLVDEDGRSRLVLVGFPESMNRSREDVRITACYPILAGS